MTRSIAPADFTDRLVPRPPAATSQAAAAPSATPDGAPFAYFTESAGVGARETDDGRPADPSAAGLPLCDHTMILLRAIADYEQCSNEHAVALALAAYATRIGAGPLARAVLDERERVGRGRGFARDDVAEDIHDLPDCERRQLGRFSRAREALRNNQGMRPAFALRASEGER
jgi:hypothetical protein